MADEKVRIQITAKDKATKVLGGVHKKLLQIGVAYMGWRTIKGVVTGIVEAGINYEKVWNDVEASVRRHNLAVDESMQKIQSASDAMQTMTGVSDELIGKGIQRLIDANFTLDEAIGTVGTSMDLAVGLQMDFRMMNELLAKSIDSSTNALTRYGITIDKSLPRAEQLRQLQESVEKSFGGGAAARMDTISGKFDLLGQTVGDLQEKIFGLGRSQLDQSLGIMQTAVFSLHNVFTLLWPEINKTEDAITDLTDVVDPDAIKAMTELGETFGTMVGHVVAFHTGTEKQKGFWEKWIDNFKNANSGLIPLNLNFGSFIGKLAQGIPFLSGFDEGLKSVLDSVDELDKKTDKSLLLPDDPTTDKIKATFDELVALGLATEEQILAAEIKHKIKSGELTDEQGAQQFLAYKKRIEDNKAALDQITDDEVVAHEYWQELTRMRVDDYNAALFQLQATEEQRLADEIMGMVKRGELGAEEAAARYTTGLERIERNREVLAEMEAEELAFADHRLMMEQELASGAASIAASGVNKIVAEMQQGRKDLAGIFKAIAADFAQFFIKRALMKLAGPGGFVYQFLDQLSLFDVAANDRMAMDMGRDYVSYFRKGVMDELSRVPLGNAFLQGMTSAYTPIGSVGMGGMNNSTVINYSFTFSGNVMDEEFIRATAVPAIERAVETRRSNLVTESAMLTGETDAVYN